MLVTVEHCYSVFRPKLSTLPTHSLPVNKPEMGVFD
jgi:hypothetical protein